MLIILCWWVLKHTLQIILSLSFQELQLQSFCFSWVWPSAGKLSLSRRKGETSCWVSIHIFLCPVMTSIRSKPQNEEARSFSLVFWALSCQLYWVHQLGVNCVVVFRFTSKILPKGKSERSLWTDTVHCAFSCSFYRTYENYNHKTSLD